MEFLLSGEDLVIETPRVCPECEGRLWRNGSYYRSCMSLDVCARIVVPRVVCPECRKSGTCLFEFLSPYKRYEGAVSVLYVDRYLEPEETYRGVGWCEEDGDRGDAEASLSRAYRAVDEACASAELLLQQVQQECVENGTEIPELEGQVMQRQNRARTNKKAEQLSFLSDAIRLIKRVCSGWSHHWLNLRRNMSRGYTLKRLGFQMSGPQTLKHPLF